MLLKCDISHSLVVGKLRSEMQSEQHSTFGRLNPAQTLRIAYHIDCIAMEMQEKSGQKRPPIMNRWA